MESIPEEISKANLHSSNSKVGHHQFPAGGLTFSNPMIIGTQQYIGVESNHQQQQSSVLQQYVKDLVAAGKSESELITDLEGYYDTLC